MRQFFKYTFASMLGTVIAIAVLFPLGIGALIVMLVALNSQNSSLPEVKKQSILVLDLGLRVDDTHPPSTTSTVINETLSGTTKRTITLREFLDTMEAAIADDRITALYLQGTDSEMGTGWANLREMRAALQRFRDAGKQILAYDLNWSKKEYYLASVADRVIVHPMGNLELNGLSAEVMFLGGAMQKYGIGIQVVRAGKYKSAAEPFVATQLSPENRQQLQALLNSIWGDFQEIVGSDRTLTAPQVQALSEQQGILFAPEAKEKGLADDVMFYDQVLGDLQELSGHQSDLDTFTQMSFISYNNMPKTQVFPVDRSSERKIALVYAEGEIVDGEGSVGESEIGGDRYADLLRKIRVDDQVKAVVLRINSPGGSATASEVIRRELELIQKAGKPVIISMGNYAASGGYWIATASDYIFAQPNTITGSIGVFGILPNVQKIGNSHGITWDVVKTGNYGDLGTSSRPRSPVELQLYQQNVNQIYQQFIQKVATARQLQVTQVNQIAQGRVWSGKEAQGIKLVDELGGLEAAIAYAAQVTELGEDWQLQEYPKTRSLEQKLIEQLLGVDQSPQGGDWLRQEFEKFQEEVAVLKTLNDPLGMYTRMPFSVQVK